MFGSEDAAAVVRDDDKRRTVRSPQSTFDGHCLDAAPDRLDPKGARVPYALQQIRRTRARLSLPMVPVITRRYRLSSVKAFDVANDFGEHTSETIPDGHDTGTVIFGRLHVKHIIEPPVRHAAFRRDSQHGYVMGLRTESQFREPTAVERALLQRLLKAEFPGKSELEVR
jgi:hypothetical protein